VASMSFPLQLAGDFLQYDAVAIFILVTTNVINTPAAVLSSCFSTILFLGLAQENPWRGCIACTERDPEWSEVGFIA
jgi:hypothetical protein